MLVRVRVCVFNRYSFQDLPENSPRHRLSVIMRKLKDPSLGKIGRSPVPAAK